MILVAYVLSALHSKLQKKFQQFRQEESSVMVYLALESHTLHTSSVAFAKPICWRLYTCHESSNSVYQHTVQGKKVQQLWPFIYALLVGIAIDSTYIYIHPGRAGRPGFIVYIGKRRSRAAGLPSFPCTHSVQSGRVC